MSLFTLSCCFSCVFFLFLGDWEGYGVYDDCNDNACATTDFIEWNTTSLHFCSLEIRVPLSSRSAIDDTSRTG